MRRRRQRGLEETGQTPREMSPRRSLFEMGSIPWIFNVLLVCGTLFGIWLGIVATANGVFTIALLGKLVLVALSFPVIGTTVLALGLRLPPREVRRDWARRLRLRQGSVRHHPDPARHTGPAVSAAEPVMRAPTSVGATAGSSPLGSTFAALATAGRVPSYLAELGFVARQSGPVAYILPPLCAVPAGTLQMGSDKKRRDPQADDVERPQHPVALGAFQIGRYPVTVAEYAYFVAAGQRGPGDWEGQLQRLDLPVELVSWRDATAYAAWLAQLTGQSWRLPTEAEWEWAARGGDGRIYPWGDQWDPMRANTHESRRHGMTLTPVGAYAGRGDASPWGAHDMAGNVWEWTSSAYERYPNDDRQGSQRADSNERRVLRGGSCDDDARFARAAFRLYFHPDLIDISTGFRLACASPDAEPPTQAPADGRNEASSDTADKHRYT